MAKTHARRRAVGHLMVMALGVMACLMAAHALYVERAQQQQWERSR